MVFTAMTTNAPTMIASPTVTKIPSKRKQRESINKAAYQALTTVLTPVPNYTSKYTITYTHTYIIFYALGVTGIFPGSCKIAR
jgi:hypothetical protein